MKPLNGLLPTTDPRLAKKSKEVHVLDTATQHLITSIERKNRRALVWFAVSWTILLAVGVFGIYSQNRIAAQNKTHIDCIVKLLATPQKPGTTHKFITDASQTCNISFN